MFNPFLCPHLIRRGYAFDAVNMTALINMMPKMVFGTGSISSDVILWNSMIIGCGMHGHGHQADGVYRKLIKEGLIKPNQTTFVAVLSACKSLGACGRGLYLVSQNVKRP
ncbi:pentatricopeptide repeat-containing protein [Quercus suber]|uniref:Pentatricopeptide repeat-containing protein n=1 Tax=Quercus suber TaxID=58331 RepID=A0AAW0LHJ7_QUESU